MNSLLLEKLPPEVREFIYRELLHDEWTVVEQQGWSRNDNMPKKKLYPAILGVCQHIYVEASAVLYEKNVFCYEYPYICIGKDGKDRYGTNGPLAGAFERIKRLQIRYINNGDPHAGMVLRKVMAVVEHVAQLGCSLKKLYLHFDFFGDNGRLAAARLACVNKSQDLIKALANLKVGQEIKVYLESDVVSDCKSFGAFVNEIALLKGWAIFLETLTARPSEHYSSGDETDEEETDGDSADGEEADEEGVDDNPHGNPNVIIQGSNTEDQYKSEERPEDNTAVNERDSDDEIVYLDYETKHDDWEIAIYFWIWSLRPATPNTKEKVPSSRHGIQ